MASLSVDPSLSTIWPTNDEEFIAETVPPFTSTVPYATESSRVSFAPFSTTIFTLESTFMLCSVTSAPAGMVSVSVPKFPFSPLPMVPYVPDSREP